MNMALENHAFFKKLVIILIRAYQAEQNQRQMPLTWLLFKF